MPFQLFAIYNLHRRYPTLFVFVYLTATQIYVAVVKNVKNNKLDYKIEVLYYETTQYNEITINLVVIIFVCTEFFLQANLIR